MTRGELIAYLQKLNKHYKHKVKFRTGYPCDGQNSPCADIHRQILFFPPKPLFYDKHILAHEYAHIIQADDARVYSLRLRHTGAFEAIYRECCLVLGVWPIPTRVLQQQTRRVLRERGISCDKSYNPNPGLW